MKKLYRKGTVHPSPPLVSDHLSFLPATILTLAVALSPQDREVLAYLISCSSSSSSGSHPRRSSSSRYSNGSASSNSFTNSSSSPSAAVASNSTRRSTDHPASFNCNCFGCYMSYWVRWDSSPNRQLIHEILDAFEDSPSVQNKKEKSSRKERRKNKSSSGSVRSHSSELVTPNNEELPEFENSASNAMSGEVDGGEGGGCGNGEMEDEEVEKGTSVRRFVGFLGEKIWGIWS